MLWADMEKRDSEVINLVKFPLAFMVVMLHSYVAVNGFHISEVDYNHLTGTDWYSLVGITFSHVLTQVAVPMFFFISGFLFYVGIQEWQWTKYADKLKRRIKTLLVPYLSWNTVQALIIVSVMVLAYFLFGKPLDRIVNWFHEIGGLTGIYWSNQATAVIKENVIGCSVLKTYPLLIPMWFIRDLMVTVLLSPVIWWLLRRIPFLTLILLAICWIMGIDTHIPGLSFIALLFFAVGGIFFEREYFYESVFENK